MSKFYEEEFVLIEKMDRNKYIERCWYFANPQKSAIANIAYTTMLPAVALRIRDPLGTSKIK